MRKPFKISKEEYIRGEDPELGVWVMYRGQVEAHGCVKYFSAYVDADTFDEAKKIVASEEFQRDFVSQILMSTPQL